MIMHTWKLEIEYEGTRYRGWQIQHNEKTVQSELVNAARQLFAGKVEIGSSERTDVGVHALGQIAHLNVDDLQTNITPRQILQGVNDLLPHDINIMAEKPQFAICVKNEEYPASLHLWKVYRVLPDEKGARHNMIRVIDESGENYLFS